MIKLKKGQKNKRSQTTSLKKHRNGWVQVEKPERSLCMQSLCLCVCVMCIEPYCTFDRMKSNDQIDVTLIAFIINDHTFSLTHPLSHQCNAGYHLPKSKQKNHPLRKFTSKLWASSEIVSHSVYHGLCHRTGASLHNTETIHFINLKHFPGRDTSIIIYWLFLFGLLSFWFLFRPFSVLVCCLQHTCTHTDAHKHFLCSSIPGLFDITRSIWIYGQLFYLSLKYIIQNDHIKW